MSEHAESEVSGQAGAERTGVVVLGGGIAGLAAAQALRQQHGAEVLLLEASDRLGGKVVTHRDGPLVIEGGPDCFLAIKPGGMELCRELGIADRLQGARRSDGGSYIKRDGKLHRIPEGVMGLVPSRSLPLLWTGLMSFPGRIRAALEWAIPKGNGKRDETVEAFVSRRFGAEAYRWLLEPLMGGIFAGDASRLSVAATFPMLPAMEQSSGSLLRAMMKRKPGGAGGGGAGSPFVTPAGGLGEIVTALEARLDGAIRTGWPVSAVTRTEAGFRVSSTSGQSVDADGVVVALPAYVAGPVLRGLDAQLADHLESIPFVSVVIVTLVYPRSALPAEFHGNGYLVPSAEGGEVAGCTWSSNKFDGRAPDDTAIVRFFFGRSGGPDVAAWDDERLLAAVRAEWQQVFGVVPEPSGHRIDRWPKAMPQYEVGHRDLVAAIEARVEQHPGLALAGASYRGIGIPDCVVSARAAAERVAGDGRDQPARATSASGS